MTVDVQEINRKVGELRRPSRTAVRRDRQGHRRPADADRPAAGRPADRRPHAARRRARPGQDPGRPHAGARPAAQPSAASSSRPTCCPPTSSARRSTTRAAASSASRKAPSSPISSWPTRSTARRPRCKAPCWKPCRKSRSPSATPAITLEQPFLVLATQNPIEQEGTYPLPEAQVDRFMLKLKMTYPEQGRRSWRFSTAWPPSSRTS